MLQIYLKKENHLIIIYLHCLIRMKNKLNVGKKSKVKKFLKNLSTCGINLLHRSECFKEKSCQVKNRANQSSVGMGMST